MTPWIDEEKIRVGPIDAEQRRAIDAQMVRLRAAHWRGSNVPGARRERPHHASGAVTKPKCKCSLEHAERLREYNRRKSEAIRARKLEKTANGPDQIEVRFLEASAPGAVATERVASAFAASPAHA
jgi:hypothetical protein